MMVHANTALIRIALSLSEVAPYVWTVLSIFKWSTAWSRRYFYRGQHREVSFVRNLVRHT